MKRFFRVRYLLVLIIALIVATGVLGFAASNTVSKSNAGDGAEDISGYHIDNITYTLDSADAGLIDFVNFDISPDNGGVAPTVVKVQLVTTDTTTWYPCSVATSPNWHCTLTSGTPVTVELADSLRVVAVQ